LDAGRERHILGRAMRSPLFAAVAAALCCACAASQPQRPPSPAGPPPSAATAPAIEHLEERALLLLLVDRQLYEPYTVEQSMLGDETLREDLATSLGRIPDPRAGRALFGLLVDDAPAVRRAAAFALGSHPGLAAEARPPLLRAAADPDDETGALAVEALARHGASLAEVQGALAPLPEAQRWRRLLPALFRFQEDATVAVAAAALALPEPGQHARAAYALARNPRPAGAPALRLLLADPDPLVRAWAARGLGQVGDGGDLRLLLPLLADTEVGPVVQALRAAVRLVADAKAAAPADWRAPLLASLDDARPGVRLTALEVAGTWLGDEALAERLLERAREGTTRERQLAVLALAQGADRRAGDVTAEATRAADPAVRRAAAEAAGRLRLAPLLAQLAADGSPGVRAAALGARLGLAADEDAGESLAREALADPDPVVRATALDWLAEHPRLTLAELRDVLARAAADDMDDARRSSVGALRARAESAATERAQAAAILRGIVEGAPEWVLRQEAAAALEALGEDAPPIGTAGRRLTAADYRELLARAAVPRRLRLETSRGVVALELTCEAAPLTCSNFVSLAGQGFYDGLLFHRVVPDFVVQTGDPRGDGFGGPGWTIPDEINRVRYETGTLGMALSGPDTGGSQFFVTLSPQPHLDGGYTAFGRVVAGQDVLAALEQGDRLLRLREE
jgi:cyclophilin family peptidyl-prolyl cis-trans isomerase/HEAT repeat protein